MRESYLGQLLVASSTITDPMYANGVCLIVHDDETRVIGVMLNRPIEPSPEAFDAILGETHERRRAKVVRPTTRPTGGKLSGRDATFRIITHHPNARRKRPNWRK